MCHDAVISGRKTNHYLRATGASELFAVLEKIIKCMRTQHPCNIRLSPQFLAKVTKPPFTTQCWHHQLLRCTFRRFFIYTVYCKQYLSKLLSTGHSDDATSSVASTSSSSRASDTTLVVEQPRFSTECTQYPAKRNSWNWCSYKALKRGSWGSLCDAQLFANFGYLRRVPRARPLTPALTFQGWKHGQEPLFSFYTSTLYHTLYKASANALAIGVYRLAPSRPSINHKPMNLCNK